jgi:putative transport protein
MAIDVVALLSENPILLIFTVIGLGYLVADVPAGPVIGVLLVGLLFGHFGFSAPPGASSFGFALSSSPSASRPAPPSSAPSRPTA